MNFLILLIGAGLIYWLYTLHQKSLLSISEYESERLRSIPHEYNGQTPEELRREVDNKRSESLKSFQRWAIGVLAIALYYGAYSPYVEKQFNSEAKDVFLSEYQTGFADYCDYLFSPSRRGLSQDGLLYADGQAFDSNWCGNLYSNWMATAAYSEMKQSFTKSSGKTIEELKQDAHNYGAGKAISVIFSEVPYLCYGVDCTDEASEEDVPSPSESLDGY